MKDIDINIPKLFRELHGDKAKLSSIIITYSSGIIVSIITIIVTLYLNLPLWKYILLFILFIDITGGVVANLSTSTNQYYKDRNTLRVIFLLMHIIQPGLMLLIFPENYQYLIFIYLFTLGSSLILFKIKSSELQQNIAALFLVVGITISFLFKLNILTLYLFGTLYMIKLILGFSVKRPPFV